MDCADTQIQKSGQPHERRHKRSQRTFSGFCGCPFTGLGLPADPPHPDVCTDLSNCHARRASRSLCSSRQIQSGCGSTDKSIQEFVGSTKSMGVYLSSFSAQSVATSTLTGQHTYTDMSTHRILSRTDKVYFGAFTLAFNFTFSRTQTAIPVCVNHVDTLLYIQQLTNSPAVTFQTGPGGRGQLTYFCSRLSSEYGPGKFIGGKEIYRKCHGPRGSQQAKYQLTTMPQR